MEKVFCRFSGFIIEDVISASQTCFRLMLNPQKEVKQEFIDFVQSNDALNVFLAQINNQFMFMIYVFAGEISSQ
jgi:hypothetical protein